MDAIFDFLATLGTSVLLILMVGAHILEEALKGFRRFFNLEWFRAGRDDFPTSKIKALLVDQIGHALFVTWIKVRRWRRDTVAV